MFNDYLVFVWSLFLFYQFEECFFSKLKIKDTYRFFFNLLSVCTIFFLIQNTFILLLNFTIWHKYLKVQHFPFDFVIQGLFYLYISFRTLPHAVSFLDDKALMVDCFHATDLILFFSIRSNWGRKYYRFILGSAQGKRKHSISWVVTVFPISNTCISSVVILTAADTCKVFLGGRGDSKCAKAAQVEFCISEFQPVTTIYSKNLSV